MNSSAQSANGSTPAWAETLTVFTLTSDDFDGTTTLVYELYEERISHSLLRAEPSLSAVYALMNAMVSVREDEPQGAQHTTAPGTRQPCHVRLSRTLSCADPRSWTTPHG